MVYRRFVQLMLRLIGYEVLSFSDIGNIPREKLVTIEIMYTVHLPTTFIIQRSQTMHVYGSLSL